MCSEIESMIGFFYQQETNKDKKKTVDREE